MTIKYEGIYQIIKNSNFSLDDAAFSKIYGVAADQSKLGWAKPLERQRVAIVDSGITDLEYFQDHAARYEEGFAMSADFTDKEAVIKLTDGAPKTEGKHGSHVGSVAAYGTAKIRLIDAMITTQQETGQNDPLIWWRALTWASGKNPIAVNVSVFAPWTDSRIQSVPKAHPHIVYVVTAGNSDTEIGEHDRGRFAPDAPNVILVGGCGAEGQFVSSFGHGPGVDVYVPSVNVPGLVSPDVKNSANNRNYEKRKDEYDRAKKAWLSGNKSDPEEIKRLEEEISQESSEMLKKRLNMRLKKLKNPVYTAEPMPKKPSKCTSSLLNDNGVSFGLPMVTNVIAKMHIINPTLKPTDLKRIILDTAYIPDPGRRVMNPVACYEAALKSRIAPAREGKKDAVLV